MHDGILTKFLQDGCLVLDDFLTDKEVEELRKAADELIQDIPTESHKSVFSTTEAQQRKDKYFLDSSDKVSYFFEGGAVDENGELLVEPKIALNKMGHALHWLNPIFKKYTFCEKVKETCFQLGLVDPVVVQSMYIFKNPGVGSEVIAHQDATFLYTEPVKLVGFWIALDDVTLENGCLWYASGSHLSGVHRRYTRNPDPNSEELLIYNAPAPSYPTSNFQPICVSKGACVLIHGQVVHRSEANKSERSRHAYTFHVVDMNGTTYSPENWLQPNPDQPFPEVYKN
ncbi:phytanoyl-CoA dioxygenase domain-containing protein 1 isoform X2 [Zootermopsis nevadensis]|uniref:Phytanoyl-CoA dioxygenase domain-containing protein 1 n=1 Tax=Zootermopsis nevadensis TaxID=136037 RepID=A0A067QJC2_ZOONE|nr:phytanoyl-CoA dioxygenase domain-containing protein 1 isoform X2 [Zootermopsis nevadensis]KDR07687.1 Phytanoyl-CoA dioxygenase domain-containing protein 1 [Zootermopsis nevadensis]